MAKVTAGDVMKARVTVNLDGGDVVLIPSPEAIISLSRAYDGFRPLLDAIGRFNVDAMIATVVAGVGLDGKAAAKVGEKVARTNLVSLVAPLTQYVTILLNGGRPLTDEDDDEGEGADPS